MLAIVTKRWALELTKEDVVHQLHGQSLANTARKRLDNPAGHQSRVGVALTTADQRREVDEQGSEQNRSASKLHVHGHRHKSSDAIYQSRIGDELGGYDRRDLQFLGKDHDVHRRTEKGGVAEERVERADHEDHGLLPLGPLEADLVSLRL